MVRHLAEWKLTAPAPKSDKPTSSSLDSSDAATGRRIRDARDAKGLTQQQLSVRSKWVDPEKKGVSRTALIGYEAGTSRPGTREIRVLCEALQITPNHLIYGSESPFQPGHAALEGLRGKGQQLNSALQVAFVVMALKDHERDALLSLAMSLGGHHLGDERLSGLRGMAMLLGPQLLGTLKGYFKDMTEDDFYGMPLSDFAQRLSREVSINIGTKLKFSEDGDVVGGEQTYPDPDG